MSLLRRAARSDLFRSLSRDQNLHDAADQARQLELCRYMWWFRHVLLTGAFASAAAGRWFEDTVWLVGIAAFADVIGHLGTRLAPRLSGPIAVADAIVVVALAAVGLPAELVLGIAIASLGWAASFRPGSAVGTYLGMVVSLGFAWRHHGHDIHPESGLIAFGLLGAILMIRSIRFNIGARRAGEWERLVSDGIEAIVWEEVPNHPGSWKVSAAAERMLGYPIDAWLEPGFWRTLVHPDDLALVPDGREPVERGADERTVVVRLRHADGRHLWMENRVSPVLDRSGNHVLYVGVLLDRTEQITAESEAIRFGQLVASSPIGQLLVQKSVDGPVVHAANTTALRLLAVDEPIGRLLAVLRNQSTALASVDDLLASVAADAAADEGGSVSREIEGADGRVYQATVRRVDADMCTVDFLDVTERAAAGEQLHRQARIDELTGLPNRRAFVEALTASTAASAGRPTALLVIDLDDFKEINDSLGHATGDDFLRTIGRRLALSVRGDDVVARLGGDEFALILPGCDEHTAFARGLAIVEAISEPAIVGDLRLRVRASIGLAVHPDDAVDAGELIRRADVAMYQAKERGSGCVRYTASADPFDRERLELANELEHAIATDQLVLHHQPLVDVVTGRVTGSEALVRWEHPALGLLSPDRFIELAEVSGQIRHLTRWVLRTAWTQMAALGPDFDSLDISCNLSVRNLFEADLIPWIRDTIAETRIDPARVKIEITESMVMDDHAAATEVLNSLRQLGVKVWIDDFGTGHSSLARLRELPVDGVKIDRAFVARAVESTSDRFVLRSMIELVHSLGLCAVAEGVEDSATFELLRDNGCDRAQGYHLGRPGSIGRLAELAGEPVVAAGTLSSAR